ncbi:hypothetical protein [Bacillus thuringiensis]|uniref:hypothetical protein n=1 Tax=Bacillus thuringiensis TaxID=1428 RepID=UPI0021D64C10|nr:hypothetical protein [Bacillus thuringiensis]MCU7666841.1 hypothetical protein [Bacillus thuringiensis]
MSNATAIATATEPTEVKSIITDALYGSVDAQESIEILSELLFPGENLIEMIRNRKIINEITAKVKLFQEKTEIELHGIEKADEGFNVTLQFGEVNAFLAEHQKIIAHLTQVAKAYNTKLQTTYVIKQIIG